MTQRALELLALPDDSPKLLLDIGCGSGLSGETLTEEGHTWVVRYSLVAKAADQTLHELSTVLPYSLLCMPNRFRSLLEDNSWLLKVIGLHAMPYD